MSIKKKDIKTKKEEEYFDNIQKHKKLIKEIINKFVITIIKRGNTHDDSKLEEPEFSIMAKFFPILKKLTYGSDEYKENLENIKPALDIHYAKNRHHPEHFPNGISDMNLLDIVEFFCDTYASVANQDNGNIRFGVEHNRKRFGYTKELEQIFKNTIDFFDILLEKDRKTKSGSKS